MATRSKTPLRTLLMAAVAAVLALVWSAVAYQMRAQRDGDLNSAKQQGQNLASVVADHFSSYADGADLLLRRLRAQWLLDRGHFAQAVALEKNLRKEALPVRIAVLDAEGQPAYATGIEGGATASGDREIFDSLRASPVDELRIGNPETEGAPGSHAIRFSRPILDRQGKFAGVITLSASTEPLTRSYEEVDLGRNGVIGLRRLDDTLFLRWPGMEGIGAKLFDIPEGAKGQKGAGSIVRLSKVDGVERVISFQRLPDPPFYAFVGQELDTVLAEYYGERGTDITAGGFVTVVILGLALVLFSKLKREESVEGELAKSEARFRSLTELASDMYWEQDRDYRFVSSRGSGPERIMQWRSVAIGKRRWDIPYLNMTEADWAAHKARLDAREPFHDLELCRFDESGEKIWVNVSGEPVFDAAGAFTGYRGVGKDITGRKRAEALQAMEHAVSRVLAEAGDVAGALKGVMQVMGETLGWQCGRYFHWDAAGGVFRFDIRQSWHVPGPEMESFIAYSTTRTFTPGVGIVGRAGAGEPQWVANLTQDARVVNKMMASDHGMRGAFMFPVMAGGSALGVLSFTSREIRKPDERLLQAVNVIGAQIGQFIQRKLREEDLRRFRAGMDVSEDMIWLIDPARMIILDVNETACRKLGYSREELTGMGPHKIISIEREKLAAIYRGLSAGAESTVVENSYHRKDGGVFPVEVFRRVIQSEGSEVIVAVARDITGRRAAEEELRRFRVAMNNSADMIVLIDRKTMRFVDVNETACRLLGYAREELLRLGPQDVLPVSRGELERDYDALIARPSADTGLVLSGMKSHYICKDGSHLPFEATRHVLRSGDSYIIAAISRDIRARLAFEEKVAYLAQFDSLTGLPNRNLFQDRLTQAMARAKRNDWTMAVMFIDLDRFKLVNDTLGHGAGDKLLKEAAERLKACTRSSDTVGRLGGDEFAAILAELGKPGDAGLVAQKIVEAFKQPFVLEGRENYVTASIGITLYPNDSDSAEALVVNADAAMYQAKEQGRNNYQYFTRDMNERARARVQLESALRRALEREELRLIYQPKASLTTGRISGFEALMRWQHPEKGLVSPVEFIPVLEETGLIVQAGEWALRAACAQIRAWESAGLKPPPVSVNLSARQFRQKNLSAVVRQILEESGVDPSHVEFEITESLLMDDPQDTTSTLRGLKAAGVMLSMDDFGTGYSSLGYLKRFPIDTLKIDRTFVRDITTDADDATLTRAIIHLAQDLRLKVVAEGVETEEQLAFLRSNGCDEMQGYLFARPTGAEECAQMLREGRKLALPRIARKNGAQLKRA